MARWKLLKTFLLLIITCVQLFIGTNGSDPKANGNEIEVTCDYVNKTATVKGRNVKFSDFLPSSPEDETKLPCETEEENIAKMFILASDTLYVDRDITKPGLEMVMISDTWEIVGERRTINLNGRDDPSLKIPKPEKPSEPSGNGTHGMPGLPGGNGGIFLGMCRYKASKKSGNNTLFILANGGKGGTGQDGGDGNDGPEGFNATLLHYPSPIVFAIGPTPKEYKEDFYIEWGNQVVREGGKQGDGGNGAWAGVGGLGGHAGIIDILFLKRGYRGNEFPFHPLKAFHKPENLNIVKPKYGDYGREGKPGKAGQGTEAGFAMKCKILYGLKPRWLECSQYNNFKWGIRPKGRNGYYFSNTFNAKDQISRKPMGNPFLLLQTPLIKYVHFTDELKDVRGNEEFFVNRIKEYPETKYFLDVDPSFFQNRDWRDQLISY